MSDTNFQPVNRQQPSVPSTLSEFVLSWSPGGEQHYREIMRQQYNFSPPNVTSEIEDYVVDLDGVAALELLLIPDISGGLACASLVQLRLV